MNSLQLAFELAASLFSVGLGVVLMMSRDIETDEEELDY